MSAQFGVVGLAVMGENLALNVERNGFKTAVYNRTWEKTETFLNGRANGKNFVGSKTLQEFVKSLERPRRILLMVKAGAPVDDMIAQIKPYLEPGDILIDGGNSHFPDTDRRVAALAKENLMFFGMGVSGGEEGALWGPSMMPGGDEATWKHLEPILTKVCAKADGQACVAYCGAKSAGHFVKMVHNGIEYGDMQLIAESYDLLKYGLGLSAPEIQEVFTDWNNGDLKSFLIEITSKIVNFPDDQGGNKPLVDVILDKAGQKGTGKWTTVAALDLGVPVPTMTAAVDARIMSGFKDTRVIAHKAYGTNIQPLKVSAEEKKAWINKIRSALYASKICSYAQGFVLLNAASKEYGYGTRLGEMARIWKAGCIIRAVFLDSIKQAFDRNPNLANLLLDESFKGEIQKREAAWRDTVGLSLKHGFATPAMAASLAYFDTFKRDRLPANVIQGQRDYFGAHTYERTDKPGTFHTNWIGRKD